MEFFKSTGHKKVKSNLFLGKGLYQVARGTLPIDLSVDIRTSAGGLALAPLSRERLVTRHLTRVQRAAPLQSYQDGGCRIINRPVTPSHWRAISWRGDA